MVGPRWRRRILMIVPALLLAAVVAYTSFRIIAFAQLFGLFKPHSGIRITQGEIAAAHKLKPGLRTPVVPKIIHQIFHNWHDATDDTLRPDWEAARKTCVDLHPGWEYMVSLLKSLLGGPSGLVALFDHSKLAYSCGRPRLLANSSRKSSLGSYLSMTDTHIQYRE